MKYCLEKYHLGSFKGQKTPGKYMDGYVHDNIKVLSKKIVDDMTFLGVCFSSTLEVGAGKSVFMSQIGEAYTEMVNQIHGLDLEFTSKNIVFRPETLIERAFELPKYSCIILDEWEDAHYMSRLGITLRQFFRKCRQLNLFIIIIIPNFFQLPIGYAISRSVFAVDVKFMDEFDRGYFSFYNFKKKKELYLKGKKTQDYDCVEPNFSGRFTDGYGIPEKAYRMAKYNDMLRADKESKNKILNAKQIKSEVCRSFRKNIPELTIKKLSLGFGVSERTITRWLSEGDSYGEDSGNLDPDTETQ